MTGLLTGKIALVAGATRGGRQIAVQLGAAGATVYATASASARLSPVSRVR